MKTLLWLFASCSVVSVVSAQMQSSEPFPLWAEGASDALGSAPKDVPTLTAFLPDADKATGAAMVVCPGGGYGHLAKHEGEEYALWLNDLGIAAFVLKYRLGTDGYRHPAMVNDASRAVRLVRARAAEWKIDPKRVGIIGSSAGGHLASTLATHFDAGDADAEDAVERHSSRPDLAILCYPVITLGEFTHQGSKRNLLGEEPAAELVQFLSNELQVTTNTPPCFLWHTWEDRAVPVENSLQFAAALRKADVPFDLHVYEKGGHGMGLGVRTYDREQLHPWVLDCEYWLRGQGFAK